MSRNNLQMLRNKCIKKNPPHLFSFISTDGRGRLSVHLSGGVHLSVHVCPCARISPITHTHSLSWPPYTHAAQGQFPHSQSLTIMPLKLSSWGGWGLAGRGRTWGWLVGWLGWTLPLLTLATVARTTITAASCPSSSSSSHHHCHHHPNHHLSLSTITSLAAHWSYRVVVTE